SGAPTTVLLSGESGTGKEVLARAIHDASPRRSGPFVAVNCAAIPSTLMESTFFGHERGAFSGATDRKLGTFEQASGGTILLDEVSELPLELQAKLLRVIQERQVTRLGSANAVTFDVRIIATTNRDLAQMVRDGSFRQDLFYRLNVFPITLPPLRERLADLPSLCSLIVERLTGRMGRPAMTISSDAMRTLGGHSFPGNVRELQNLLERAVVLSAGTQIESSAIVFDEPMFDSAPVSVPRFGAPANDSVELEFAGMTLAEVERRVILETLQHAGGNRTRTSQLLGISIRTLRNRLRDYRGAGYPIAAAA
ncbi:MAG: two-component system response regulator FlrC, partial [Myxococcota bacterium]